MNNTKKTLLASGISIAVSLVLLVGATFAVFTGSVSNTGNRITAGTLKMGAYAYGLVDSAQPDGTSIEIENESYNFTSTGQDLRTNNQASIDEKNFDPDKIYAKLYEVKNEGSLDFKFKFDFFNSFDGGLGDKLWFDFVEVQLKDGKYSLAREIDKTKNLNAIESYLDEESGGSKIEKGTAKKYLFLCGIKEEQKLDDFQSSKYNFKFDIEIKAAQLNGEFPTISKEESLKAEISDAAGVNTMMRYINNGNDVEVCINGEVQLDNVMVLKEKQKATIEIKKDAVFKLPNQVTSDAGFKNSKNNEPYVKTVAITVSKDAVLELKGEGVLESNDYYTIKVEDGGTLKLNGVSINSSNGYKGGIFGIYSKGNTTVENVTMTVFTDNDIVSSPENPSPLGGSTAYGIYAAGGTLNVDGCTIEVTGATNGNTGNGANGIYVNGATDVNIKNTKITGTGEGTSQNGIYCFDGKIDLISKVDLNIKGTALYTWGSIGRIEGSVLTGTTYSLYNRSDSPISISADTVLTGNCEGEINRDEVAQGTVDSTVSGSMDTEENSQPENQVQEESVGTGEDNVSTDMEQMEDGRMKENQKDKETTME